jgi:hypothetical protein
MPGVTMICVAVVQGNRNIAGGDGVGDEGRWYGLNAEALPSPSRECLRLGGLKINGGDAFDRKDIQNGFCLIAGLSAAAD